MRARKSKAASVPSAKTLHWFQSYLSEVIYGGTDRVLFGLISVETKT